MHMSKIFQRQYYSSTSYTDINIEKKIKKQNWWWAYLNLCCVLMFNMQFIANFTIKTLFSVAEIF
jgi:hypothetical protein